MGLFDIFKKKQATERKPEIKFTATTPPASDPQSYITPVEARIRECTPSRSGLYPHEILMLHYAEKYKTEGNTYQQFWLYDYGVSDADALLKSLVQRGFVTVGSAEECVKSEKAAKLKELLASKGAKTTGKKEDLVARVLETFSAAEIETLFPVKNYSLTNIGRDELAENEYVPYLHLKKYYDLNPFKLNVILGNSGKRYRDAIWKYFNDKLFESFGSSDYVVYAMTLSDMAKFLAEEGRYKDAIRLKFDVAYVDMNSRANELLSLGKSYAAQTISHLFPYEESLATIRPGVVHDVTSYQKKLGISDAELVDFLSDSFLGSKSSTFPITLFTKEECVDAFFFERDEDKKSLEDLYSKAEKRYRNMLR